MFDTKSGLKTKKLLETWKPLLKGIKSEHDKIATARLLENQYNYSKTLSRNLLTEESLSTNISKFPKLVVPLVRRVFPGLIANEIVSVQPLDGPVGLAFSMRYVYDTTKGAYTAGDEAYVDGRTIDPLYSGSVHSQTLSFVNGSASFQIGETVTGGTSGASGTIIKFGEDTSHNGYMILSIPGNAPFVVGETITGGTSAATATIDWGSNLGYDLASGEILGSGSDNFSEGSIKIVSTSVEAITKKLKATWSQEAVDDIKKTTDVDLEKEIVDYLSYQIQAEIDREIIKRLIGLAHKNQYEVLDMASLVAGDDYRWKEEKYKNIHFKIIKMLNDVGKKSRRGRGNFVVTSLGVINALSMAKTFDISTAFGNKTLSGLDTSFDYQKGIVYMGTIENGSVKVYLDLYADNDYVLVGYKGKKYFDAGLIYAPYIPVMLAKTIQPTDFHPAIALGSRYGIIDDLLDTEKYYAYLRVDNLVI